VKRKPSAIELLFLSVLICCLPLFALINAATGDCIGKDCPTEMARATPIIIAALIALVLQTAAAVWYARAHYGE